MKISDIKAEARGNWPFILAGLGINQTCLVNRHGPCPGCGGRDRFRFDDKGGNGGWFCGGGKKGNWSVGDGFDLLVHVYGWDMKQAAQEVADYLHIDRRRAVRAMPAPVVQKKKSTKPYAMDIWAYASHLGVVGHQYAVAKDIERPGPLRRTQVTGRVVGMLADCLVVPAIGISTGAVEGVQVINPAGAKQSFGDIRGSCCILGNSLDKKLPWFVVEGYADAWSMVFHIFDGNACAVMAFSSGQMDAAARDIAEKYNPKMIMIVEDAK